MTKRELIQLINEVIEEKQLDEGKFDALDKWLLSLAVATGVGTGLFINTKLKEKEKQNFITASQTAKSAFRDLEVRMEYLDLYDLIVDIKNELIDLYADESTAKKSYDNLINENREYMDFLNRITIDIALRGESAINDPNNSKFKNLNFDTIIDKCINTITREMTNPQDGKTILLSYKNEIRKDANKVAIKIYQFMLNRPNQFPALQNDPKDILKNQIITYVEASVGGIQCMVKVSESIKQDKAPQKGGGSRDKTQQASDK